MIPAVESIPESDFVHFLNSLIPIRIPTPFSNWVNSNLESIPVVESIPVMESIPVVESIPLNMPG